MKSTTANAIIIILIVTIVGLCMILLQNQKTINSQKATIAAQQKQIDDLNSKIGELEARSPEKLINEAKTLLKQQGPAFLNSFIQKIQQ